MRELVVSFVSQIVLRPPSDTSHPRPVALMVLEILTLPWARGSFSAESWQAAVIMYLLSAQARNHYVHGSLLTSWHLSPPFIAVKSCFICKCHHVIYSWKGSHSRNSMLQFKRGARLYSQWVILKQTLLLINAFYWSFLALNDTHKYRMQFCVCGNKIWMLNKREKSWN